MNKPLERNLSCVGQVCKETEDSRVSPMYIDVILPLKGEKMEIEEARDLIEVRLLPNNPRLSSRVENNSKFVPTDVDLKFHVSLLMSLIVKCL